jgi:cytoskeletal protein RodZ
MGTLGSYLREAREARGTDLREAAQQTRINFNYLAAIENEEFSKLPGEVFVKGFLKNYAKFLQLPEGEVMKRYGEITIHAKEAPADAVRQAPTKEPASTMEQKVPERKERNLEPVLWGGVIVIALAAIALIGLPQRHAVPERTGPAATAVSPTTAVATAPAVTVAPDKLYLTIEALDDTWVLVRTDASPQKKAILKKGEAITWSADKRFLLSYGRVDSATLHLNGKELTVIGPKDAVVRDLTITEEGIAAQKVEREPRVRTLKTSTAPTATPPPSVSAPVQRNTTTALPSLPATRTAPAEQAPPATQPVPAETPPPPAPAKPISEPAAPVPPIPG